MEWQFTTTTYQNFQVLHRLGLILCSLMLFACGIQKPPPDSQKVLEILHKYPEGTLIKDSLIPEISGDETHLLIYSVRTTVDAAVQYYNPPLNRIGLETRASSRASLSLENLPIEHWWWYDGCPFHSVTLALTESELHITYSTGGCR